MGADIDPDVKSKLNDAFEIDENVLAPILNVIKAAISKIIDMNFRSLHFSLSAYNKYVCGVIDSIWEPAKTLLEGLGASGKVLGAILNYFRGYFPGCLANFSFLSANWIGQFIGNFHGKYD
jgi:hypothetical protein